MTSGSPVDAAEWDDWAVDAPPTAITRAPPVHDTSSKRHAAVSAATLTGTCQDDGSEADEEAWVWDIEALERELLTLPAATECVLVGDQDKYSDAEQQALCAVIATASTTQIRVTQSMQRIRTARALALATQWHLLQLRHALAVDEDGTGELALIETELQALSGDWSADNDLNGGSADDDGSKHHQDLQEMTALLQHALAVCEDHDLTPFQQAMEQVFASLPDHSIHIPTTWIRPHTRKEEISQEISTTDGSAAVSTAAKYLERIVSLCAEHESMTTSDHVVPVLSKAVAFQDAKDIQRDALVVNGVEVTGTIGYDAIVSRIQEQLEQQFAHTVGTELLTTRRDILRLVAQQILHSCNRTESGGCSYEILSQFISQHSMDRVLIRPDSERAPPLALSLDIGPFFSASAGGWCVGVRVIVSAVTWYWICDAQDPTIAFFDVETTYTNRLAFPLGLTPLCTSTFMRHDHGAVVLKVQPVATNEEQVSDEDLCAATWRDDDQSGGDESHPSQREGGEAEAEAEAEVDFDSLL